MDTNCFIVIREAQSKELSTISELVRKAYTSNTNKLWIDTLFNEITFQAIVLVAAFLFIFIGIPLYYCILSIPIVLVFIYIIIYTTLLMKATELVHDRKTLNSWIAEVYEPYFYQKSPQETHYQIRNVHQNEDSLPTTNQNYKRTVIGTCAVMAHSQSNEWAWLFRLAVDQRYRKKGVGAALTDMVKKWCHDSYYNYVELVLSDGQEEARQLFSRAGFQVKHLYNKRLFAGVYTVQMYHLRAEVRATFN